LVGFSQQPADGNGLILVERRFEQCWTGSQVKALCPELGLDKAIGTAKIPEIFGEIVFLPCTLAEPEL